MKERDYLLFRKIFYWFFVCAFLIFTPIIVLYSLGYKFSASSKIFQRTGAISVKVEPKDCSILLNGVKLKESAPCVLRELLPDNYSIEITKPGFHPYRLSVNVFSSSVSDVDITLMPYAGNVDKFESNLDIYRFFMIEHLFRMMDYTIVIAIFPIRLK